ncbi:MAG: mechanosensitive ion channel family protein [Gammaproteobacteria bacterium]
MENLYTELETLLAAYGLKVLAAIAVLLVGRWVAGFLRRMVERLMTKAKWDEMLVSFAGNVIYAAMLVFVILAALGQLGIETTSFIAVLGAAGLAIGLALQGSLSNFAAGFMIIIFRPFKVGDFVEAGGTSGIVEEIQIFTTRLRTGDNRTVYVPNGGIMNGNITNYSAKPTRRIDLVFGVSYDDDLQKAKQVINAVLAEDERILADPAPTVGVLELADSSVNFAVRPWVKTGDYWPVYFHLQETMKQRLEAAGLSIPYPQRDVHMIPLPDQAA